MFVRELPVIEKPAGIPNEYADHVKLMFDLQVLAFQTDLTRVGGEFVGIRHRSIFGSREPGVPREVVAMA